VVAANLSISAGYDVSIFDGIRKKIIKNLTLNYISCVDEELFKLSNLLHGALDGQRAGSNSHAPSPKFGTAVQSYVYYYPAGCSGAYFQTPRPLCKK